MNNPVNLVDPTGMAPEDLRFRGPGAKKAINTINRGLGGNYASLENGKVNLNVTDDQLNSMTSEQKGFYDVVNSAVTHEETTEIGVVESGVDVMAGSFSASVIDIDDIDNFGTGELMNSTTVLGHEIHEQYQKQALGNTDGSNDAKTEAHDLAEKIEATMNGSWERGELKTTPKTYSKYEQKNQLGGGTKTGTTSSYKTSIEYKNSKGVTRSFNYEVRQGNIVKQNN